MGSGDQSLHVGTEGLDQIEDRVVELARHLFDRGRADPHRVGEAPAGLLDDLAAADHHGSTVLEALSGVDGLHHDLGPDAGWIAHGDGDQGERVALRTAGEAGLLADIAEALGLLRSRARSGRRGTLGALAAAVGTLSGSSLGSRR
jgi:hypothetical protein